ncbi:MAG: TPM domain-containing protein [Deltaproteobacteria bacterium]|nr:TPM domain-containing protein [Deltaproteobacteria bacterium]
MRKLIFTVLACVLYTSITSCGNNTAPSSITSYIKHSRPSHETRIFDNAHLIKYKNSLDSHLETLYTFANIDMVVVTFEDLQGNDIDDTAAQLLSNWKIGENTNGLKGILFVLSVEEELVRFEIGYDLEWIYPDSFVGYIERDQMAPFFEAGRVQDGIAATLEMIIARANEKIENQAYNPDDGERNLPGTYYSGGAGAKQQVRIKTVKIPDKANYPDDIKSLFVPQPTPEDTYLLDIEKCKRHIRGYDFDLYTDETREISKNWVFTKAQMDNEVNDTRGKTFKVFAKDDLAIIVFEPKYRNCPPYYLKRNNRGWQIDIATMSKTIHFDMRNRAHIGKSRYFPLFKENGYTFSVNGFLYCKGQEPAYLGVSSWDGSTKTATVNTLVKNSPAEKAGLRIGDTIIKVGDINVLGTREIVKAENKYKIGEIVAVKVKRGLISKEFDVMLESYDPYK